MFTPSSMKSSVLWPTFVIDTNLNSVNFLGMIQTQYFMVE